MIFVALGANVPSQAGSPEVTLRCALGAMAKRGIAVISVSPFYRTPAWPNPADPPFVNAVAEVRTRLLPGELLKALLAIEKAFGRVRKKPNEPRTLDLDLIDYGGLVSDADELSLPHPRMHERVFVLRPLADIAPHWRHPDTGEGIGRLLENVGEAGVKRLVEG